LLLVLNTLWHKLSADTKLSLSFKRTRQRSVYHQLWTEREFSSYVAVIIAKHYYYVPVYSLRQSRRPVTLTAAMDRCRCRVTPLYLSQQSEIHRVAIHNRILRRWSHSRYVLAQYLGDALVLSTSVSRIFVSRPFSAKLIKTRHRRGWRGDNELSSREIVPVWVRPVMMVALPSTLALWPSFLGRCCYLRSLSMKFADWDVTVRCWPGGQ